jgi:hypothetical protein
VSSSWADPHFGGLCTVREDVRLADRAIERLVELVDAAARVELDEIANRHLRLAPPPYPPRHA